MRVCIYTKRLAKHIDEGFIKVAHEVIHQLARHHEVLALFSMGDHAEREGLTKIPTNPSGLNLRLRATIRRFRPDVILYIPRSGASPESFWLARLLGCYGGGVPVAMLTTQPNDLGSLSRKIVPLLKPDLILTASTKEQQDLARMGCTVRFVPLGVNIDKFTPVDSDRKGELRAKYGVGKEDFIALHVGHMNQGRNIRALEQIQDSGNQVLIIGSTFFPHDAALIRDLEAHGIRFLTGYIDHIEEIYQLADCYVFPTLSERACISQPLSMLEAMACNLPVVSTKFGGVPDLFPDEEGGLLYVDSTSELAAKVSYIREAFRHISPRTREMVAQYSWDRSVREILRLVEESLSPATTASNTGDNARRLG